MHIPIQRRQEGSTLMSRRSPPIIPPDELSLRKHSIAIGVGLGFGGYRYRWENSCGLRGVDTVSVYRQVNIHSFRHEVANICFTAGFRACIGSCLHGLSFVLHR